MKTMNLKDKEWELLQAWKMIRYHVYCPLEIFPQAAMDTLDAHFGTGNAGRRPVDPPQESAETNQ